MFAQVASVLSWSTSFWLFKTNFLASNDEVYRNYNSKNSEVKRKKKHGMTAPDRWPLELQITAKHQDFNEKLRFLRRWLKISTLVQSRTDRTACGRSQLKPVDYKLPYWKLPSHRLRLTLDLIFARWCLSESQPKNCPMTRCCRQQIHSSLLKSLLCF